MRLPTNTLRLWLSTSPGNTATNGQASGASIERMISVPSTYSINVPAMTDRVDHYGLFIPEYIINDTVVSYTELVKSYKVAGQRLKTSRFQRS